VRANATETADVKRNEDRKLAHQHCHHHHRCRRYQPGCCCVASSYELKMGLVGPWRQKADSETASPFLPLLRWGAIGDAWNARAPSSAGAIAYASVGRIASREP
jgi:hypothetical protein